MFPLPLVDEYAIEHTGPICINYCNQWYLKKNNMNIYEQLGIYVFWQNKITYDCICACVVIKWNVVYILQVAKIGTNNVVWSNRFWLIHCHQEMSYSDIDLGQYWLMKWLPYLPGTSELITLFRLYHKTPNELPISSLHDPCLAMERVRKVRDFTRNLTEHIIRAYWNGTGGRSI